MDLQFELERWYRTVIWTEQRHQALVHVECVGTYTLSLSLSLSLSNSDMWTVVKVKLPITALSCSPYNQPHNVHAVSRSTWADWAWAEEKSYQRYTRWPPMLVPQIRTHHLLLHGTECNVYRWTYVCEVAATTTHALPHPLHEQMCPLHLPWRHHSQHVLLWSAQTAPKGNALVPPHADQKYTHTTSGTPHTAHLVLCISVPPLWLT